MLKGFRLAISMFILSSLITPSVWADNITIICNKSVKENVVTKSDIKKIFTGNMKRWSDNSKINIALLKNKKINTAFFNQYVGMSRNKYSRYIKKKVHISGFKQPKSVGSDKEMIEYIASTKGAVGYVTSDPDSWGTWLIKPLAIK